MKIVYNFVSFVLVGLLLSGCAGAPNAIAEVNYEQAACDAQAELDAATNSSAENAWEKMFEARASLVAWLGVWEDAGVSDARLHELLVTKVSLQGAFMDTSSPEDATAWLEFEENFADEISSICTSY
jgi:hypothetical protein